MLAKIFYYGVLLVAASLMITGCATTDKGEGRASSRYEMASDECIRFGHRRDSYDYNRCIEKILKSGKDSSSTEAK